MPGPLTETDLAVAVLLDILLAHLPRGADARRETEDVIGIYYPDDLRVIVPLSEEVLTESSSWVADEVLRHATEAAAYARAERRSADPDRETNR